MIRNRKRKEPVVQVEALPAVVRVTGRGLRPDPRYGELMVTKFINCMMYAGQKSTAQRVFYDALKTVQDKTGNPAIDVFKAALDNVKPVVEVKSKRVGGATYQVPVEVNRRRALGLAIRWILEAARGKKGRPMAERLANEIIDASKKEGAAITKRENTHKMAEANKAFAHYAW
jgi:small subunit ribosomal protein S7